MIAFGFGSPLISLAMLIVTGLVSFLAFRIMNRMAAKNLPPEHRAMRTRAELRQYYYEQRRQAREFSAEFDISDDEIEERIERELKRNP